MHISVPNFTPLGGKKKHVTYGETFLEAMTSRMAVIAHSTPDL